MQPPPEFLPIERAARIVAPISDDIEHRYFYAGVQRVLRMLGEFDIAVEAQGEPPVPPFDVPRPPLTREWFAAIGHHHGGIDHHQTIQWRRAFVDWSRNCLNVSRPGILANLSPPSGQHHAPVENVDTAGASWSFPQTLAWIATRDPLEVARMQHGQHFGPPMDDAQPGLRSMLQSDAGRRLLVGWLVIRTSLDHCTCGSRATPEREAWEVCQCVGNAYDELRSYANGSGLPIPEYQPKPANASFTLTWPDGADGLRFARADIIKLWPQQSQQRSTAGGEVECSEWLERAILADNPRQRTKASFLEEALSRFSGRVSENGFNQRIWPPIAQRHGRNRPGAPRKS